MDKEPLPVFSQALLDQLYRHAEETYPEECCGMLLGSKLASGLGAVRKCKNVYDIYHQEDPEQFPRTSKTAYLIDPAELLQIQKELRVQEKEIKVIYHSHVDVGAYFSEEDKRVATFDGEPVFPGVAYLVISCARGHSEGAALFMWDEKRRDFVKSASYFRPS